VNRLRLRWVTALLWAALPALCQRASLDATLRTTDKPYIQANGEATISVQPDQALVDIGVVSQGTTASAAAAQNAKLTDAVVAQLGALLKDKKKLKTTNYSVAPNYTYPKSGAPTISGYTATNVVQVTLDDLGDVSKVIDAATQSGANIVQGMQYQLKNPGLVRAEALKQAAEKARASAEAMAVGLGLKVVRVLSVEEAMPEEGFAMSRKAPAPPMNAHTAPPTPIEIGTIDVDVSVVLRVEVGQ